MVAHKYPVGTILRTLPKSDRHPTFFRVMKHMGSFGGSLGDPMYRLEWWLWVSEEWRYYSVTPATALQESSKLEAVLHGVIHFDMEGETDVK